MSTKGYFRKTRLTIELESLPILDNTSLKKKGWETVANAVQFGSSTLPLQRRFSGRSASTDVLYVPGKAPQVASRSTPVRTVPRRRWYGVTLKW